MESLLEALNNLNQDQGIVLLFACLLVFCTMIGGASLLFRSLGKWGVVALMIAGAAVYAVWRLA